MEPGAQWLLAFVGVGFVGEMPESTGLGQAFGFFVGWILGTRLELDGYLKIPEAEDTSKG